MPFRFGNYEFDPESRDLRHGNDVQRLRPQPAVVLCLLLERPHQVVGREELYSALWPDAKVEYDLGLNAAVRALRSALGDDASAPRFVETIRRKGYRLNVDVERVERFAEPSTERRGGARGAVWAAGVALLVAIFVGLRASAAGPAEGGLASQPSVDASLTQARFLVDQGDLDGSERAIALLESLPEGTRDEPTVLALMAEAHIVGGQWTRGEELAHRVLAIDAESPDARRVLGGVALYHDLKPNEAVRLLGEAVRLAPTAKNHHAYALALAAAGRDREAMEAVRVAVKLDPVGPILAFDAAWVAYLARDFTTSRGWCDQLAALKGPGEDTMRCHLYPSARGGTPGEAARIARDVMTQAGASAVELPSPSLDPDLALERFWEWEIEFRGRSGRLSEGQLAFVEARSLAQLGRLEEALERLAVARDARVPAMAFAAHAPYFDPISTRSEFQDIVSFLWDEVES